MSSYRLTPAEIAAIEESRAKQGLPPKIEDPAVLRKVAELIVRAGGGRK